MIPSFNDWAALALLLPRIDRALAGSAWRVSVLVVDDASTEPGSNDWPGGNFTTIEAVEILHLRCNLGHQRAIALGLYQVHEFTTAAAVVVMDGDGEDRPEDLPALLAEFERGCRREIVFAARGKRLESWTFQFFYRAYRVIHYLLTGIAVRVGNFSVVPRESLTRLMAVSDLWNHYAAAVYRARLPRRLLPLSRGRRLAGESRMNFVSLLVHGLTAISVFGDQVSARLLAASAVFTVLAAGLISVTAVIRLGTGLAAPGWVTYTIASLAIMVLQSVTFAALLVFAAASRRNGLGFLPPRDAPFFILGSTVAAGASPLARLGETLLRADVPIRPVAPAGVKA
ncbi:MAG: glycosyltransferase [Pseudomonadota bacterium]